MRSNALVEDNSIDYHHFFQEMLEAIPWPLLIIDRSLSVHYYNHNAVQLLEAQEPLTISNTGSTHLRQSNIRACPEKHTA